MLKKQIYRPKHIGPRDVASVRSLGLDHPEGTSYRQGKDWGRYQACHQDTFSLVAMEIHRAATESISCTKLEEYIKVNFWLSGRHTTVLGDYGQHDHDRPEIFITAGPLEMIKTDVLIPGTPVALVALCLLRDFFPRELGIEPEELPDPLRAAVLPESRPHFFHRFSLTQGMVAAVHAILAAPFSVRRDSRYAHAKAVELMCLLVDHIRSDGRRTRGGDPQSRREARLYEAREILTERYAEAITLEQLARQVGLNRLALTSGFRELFGTSVYDYLQKVRMERAYEVLLNESLTIAQVAEAVGYGHACNFSTAFRARFGCTPQQARQGHRQPHKKLRIQKF